jgi:hypothetical protein
MRHWQSINAVMDDSQQFGPCKKGKFRVIGNHY